MAQKAMSIRYDVELNQQYDGEFVSSAVEEVAAELGIYVSHIGSYSRKKYPNSIHWHFKESPKEIGCLDATFWEEGNEFWIVVRNYEPKWVTKRARQMQKLLNKKFSK